jgi:hypothetical protein
LGAGLCQKQAETGVSIMGNLNLPLSGAVTQTINPWTFISNPSYSFGPITVNLGYSNDTDLEQDVLSKASYGRQLGIVEDALVVMLKHLKLKDLGSDDEAVIDNLKNLLRHIAESKNKHKSKHVLPLPDHVFHSKS